MKFHEALRPDCFESLCDTVSTLEHRGMKRSQKSVDRTLAFLDACLELKEKSDVSVICVFSVDVELPFGCSVELL